MATINTNTMNSVASSNKTDMQTPLVSVMIPVFQPNHYLLKTLTSVLQQLDIFSLGPVQIVVLDDASPTVDVCALIGGLAGIDHVELHRNEKNLGLAGNWNRAIELAKGEFIHILHQDDVVLPGFYSKLCKSLQQHPEVGMAFCRHAIIDADDVVQRTSHRERWRSGVLRNWLARITTRTRIQCPAAIVRRSTYEAVGLFRTDLKFALDWEMWVRIAVHYPVWYEASLLALYRRHADNESARLASLGANEPDVLNTIAVFSSYLPQANRKEMTGSAYEYFVRSRLKQLERLFAAGLRTQALALIPHVTYALRQLPQDRRHLRFERRLSRARENIQD